MFTAVEVSEALQLMSQALDSKQNDTYLGYVLVNQIAQFPIL